MLPELWTRVVDALVETVDSTIKRVSLYPNSEATLVSKIFKGVNKHKTYDLFMSLEKAGRIKKHLSYYIEYQFYSVKELEETFHKRKKSLALFEMLLIAHLIGASSGKERLFNFKKYFSKPTSHVIEFPEPEVSDVDWYKSIIDQVKTDSTTMSLEDFAETLVIPSGQYKGKLYRHYRAPYNRQIHKWMSAESDIHTLVNMWSVQVGKSTAVENACIYYMKIVPSEILAVLATADAAEKFSKKRIEPRAARAGIKFIAENFGDTKKRDTGNKILSKEFFGGNFDAATAGSGSQLASETKRILLEDELDRWVARIADGDPEKVADKRADAWGNRAKKIKVSSPLIKATSRIYKAFKKGTQHHFHIECPVCDVEYPLEMGMDQSHGLKYETEAGVMKKEHVFYICPHCQEAWQEKSKLGAMQKGEWVAHATALQDGYISTQLNALYSPFRSWLDVCIEHKGLEDDPEGEQEFDNMTLGLPHEPKGSRPEIEAVYSLRDFVQKSGEVPEDVLFLTASCDVQRGSNTITGKKKNPARLEIEIKGHCDNFETKSIAIYTLLGETNIADKGAWEKLRKMMDGDDFNFKRSRDKMIFTPMIWLIDARDGKRTEVVYQFCRNSGKRVFPSMGTDYIRRTDSSGGSEDKVKTQDFHRYKKKRIDSDITMYLISTNYYKKSLYHNLDRSIERRDEEVGFFGRCGFPSDYPDWYFDQLTAEELKPDGTFFCPSGKRNEALDLHVYNSAGADIWMGLFLDNLKARAKASGKKNLEYIDYKFARKMLAEKTKQLWIDAQ